MRTYRLKEVALLLAMLLIPTMAAAPVSRPATVSSFSTASLSWLRPPSCIIPVSRKNTGNSAYSSARHWA